MGCLSHYRLMTTPSWQPRATWSELMAEGAWLVVIQVIPRSNIGSWKLRHQRISSAPLLSRFCGVKPGVQDSGSGSGSGSDPYP
jgi:hypothetical protein